MLLYLFAEDPVTQAQTAFEAGRLVESRILFKAQPEKGAAVAFLARDGQQSEKPGRAAALRKTGANRLEDFERGEAATGEPDLAVLQIREAPRLLAGARDCFVQSPRLASAAGVAINTRQRFSRTHHLGRMIAPQTSGEWAAAGRLANETKPLLRVVSGRSGEAWNLSTAVARMYERQHMPTQAAREQQFEGKRPAAPKAGMR